MRIRGITAAIFTKHRMYKSKIIFDKTNLYHLKIFKTYVLANVIIKKLFTGCAIIITVFKFVSVNNCQIRNITGRKFIDKSIMIGKKRTTTMYMDILSSLGRA